MFPQVFGKYVLERPIALGGMASVYLATLRGAGGFEKKLVVKQIRTELASDEAFIRRFVEEAKTTVELSHPNIVPVYELGVEQGVYYLAMELCDGVTLADLLRAERRLSPEQGAYIGVEICRALDYAHRKAGIVHRDVTPRNVLIDEEGGVRLIDFGIAARAHVGNVEVFGSPGHMSPEQLRGDKVGPPTDVFAVGALLYEAWSGKPAFRRKTAEDSERALSEEVPLLTTVDPRLAPLQEVIRLALALDPAKRPARAEDLARPLRKFVSQADLGDLARRLGSLVRTLAGEQRGRRLLAEDSRGERDGEGGSESQRANAGGASVDTDGGEGTASASGSGSGDRGPGSGATRTFAMRREARKWAADDGGPATRQLPEEAGISSTRRRGKPRSSAVATWAAPALGVVAVTAGLLTVFRGTPREERIGTGSLKGEPATLAPSSSVAATPASIDSSLTALPSSAAAESPPPDHRPTDATRNVAAPIGANATSGATPASSSVPSGGPARVRLLATPEATIEVDGRDRGRAPLEVTLPAGIHLVRFTCAPTGETLPQTVRLAAGDQLTVSADFTGATPRASLRK